MKRILIICALVIWLLSGKSQSFEYKNFKWDSIPFFSYNLAQYKEYEAYGLKTKYLLEYAYDKESSELFTYVTIHRKYLVVSNDALDDLNKIYISMNDVKEIVDIQARFITSDNKVTYVDKKNIKEIKNNDDESSGYQQFAIEGASSPGIIEYYYVLKKEPQISGKYLMQFGIPSYNVEFEIYSPENLKILTKGYNGFKTPEDKLLEDKGKWHYYTKMDSIPALPKEEYALNDANKQRIEYTLAYNYANNRSRIRTFDNACHTYYSIIFNEEKNYNKILKKTLKEIKIRGLSEENTVRKIEDWVKNNIGTVEGKPVKAGDIEATLNNKYTNNTGMIILLANLYRCAEIPVEVVVTCDRYDRKFDPDFDGWNFLDDILLFFPNIKKYVEPSDFSHRLGFFSPKYFDNYGVYMSTITVDYLTSFKYKSKIIPATSYLQNGDSLVVIATLDENMETMNLDIKKVYTGENAATLQPYYRLLEPDNKTKLVNAYIKLCDNFTIDSYSVKNDAATDLFINPFIIEANAHATITEQAGNKIVVKLGQLIGNQAELYNVKKRQQPVDVQNVHYYYRKIVFNIPEGYKVVDVSTMNINVVLNDENLPSAGFVSKATLDGSNVIVEVSEYYKKMSYPIELFEQFRNVINAAADFNKRSIVLEKKQQ